MTTSRNVVSLAAVRRRRRINPLIPEIAWELAATGTLVRHLDEPTDVDSWREAGRAAGRRLGVRVRTGSTRCGCVGSEGVHVWVLDINREATVEDQLRAVMLLKELYAGRDGD
jgi:hypothetical protein